MMYSFKILLLCASVFVALGDDVPFENLPPILKSADGLGHLNPVPVDSVQEKPIFGRPDGHEPGSKRPIGGPEDVNKPLIGQPDGHEPGSKPIIGQDDGHDGPSKPIGQNDGHDSPSKPLIGQDDGHDEIETFEPDWFQESIDEDMDSDLIPDDDADDDDSDDAFDNDDKFEYEDEYEQEELIRCKQNLMCTEECQYGYQTDERACPTCDCVINPCKNITCAEGTVCVPDEATCWNKKSCSQLTTACMQQRKTPAKAPEEFPCAMPMCANFCEYGYFYDERGCMKCECNEKPLCPKLKCAANCDAGYVTDENGCRTCTCLPSKEQPMKTPVCAEPMCATRCDEGYKKNEYGCMTCDCVESEGIPCDNNKKGTTICEKMDKCKTKTSDDIETKVCVAKPLCNLMKERRSMNTLKCDDDGAFAPLQCNNVQSECWCVDDRGVEIDSSRTSVYIDEHKPICVRNYTVAVTVQMSLTAYHLKLSESELSAADQIENALPLSIQKCTLIDKEFISAVSVQERVIKDLDYDDERNVERMFNAQVIIRRDGFSDIPSAMERLKRKVLSQDCVVTVGSENELNIEPEKLVIDSTFSLPSPRMPLVIDVDTGMYTEQESWTKYCMNHRFMVLGALLATLLLIMSLLVFALLAIRRRRMRRVNFQRLQNQISTVSEKSLMENRDDNVLLIHSGPVEEKKILA